MTTASALALDLARPERLVAELERADALLAREPEPPAAVTALVIELSEAILAQDVRRVGEAGIDAGLWIELQQVAHRASLAARDGRAERRELRLAVEGLRFLLARIAERSPLAGDRPAREVAAWLDEALTVSQAEKAELLGVSLRTYQRWLGAGGGGPAPGEERRIRLVARVVLDLRGLLSGPGVAAWLRRRHPALGRRTPLELIADGDERGLARLLALTGAARAGSAA